jgi:hypothetical protein
MSSSRNVEQQEFAKLTFSVEFSGSTMLRALARELKLAPVSHDDAIVAFI